MTPERRCPECDDELLTPDPGDLWWCEACDWASWPEGEE